MLNAFKWPMISALAIFAAPAAAEIQPAAAPQSYPALVYDTTSRAPRIPPNEQGLQTIIAEPWFSMTDKAVAPGGIDGNLFIEGPVFDRQGNLLFVEVSGGRMMRLSPNRDLKVVLPKNAAGSAGLGIHKDGRIIVAGIGSSTRGGSVFSIRPDGSGEHVIIDPQAGYVPDDLALDNQGGFTSPIIAETIPIPLAGSSMLLRT